MKPILALLLLAASSVSAQIICPACYVADCTSTVTKTGEFWAGATFAETFDQSGARHPWALKSISVGLYACEHGHAFPVLRYGDPDRETPVPYLPPKSPRYNFRGEMQVIWGHLPPPQDRIITLSAEALSEMLSLAIELGYTARGDGQALTDVKRLRDEHYRSVFNLPPKPEKSK